MKILPFAAYQIAGIAQLVERQPSKLDARVRVSLPALYFGPIAQWQSTRLITARFWVRIPVGPQIKML